MSQIPSQDLPQIPSGKISFLGLEGSPTHVKFIPDKPIIKNKEELYQLLVGLDWDLVKKYGPIPATLVKLHEVLN